MKEFWETAAKALLILFFLGRGQMCPYPYLFWANVAAQSFGQLM
jgi:hypothetical protein